ncbi:MAG TPA: hypothetical protein VJW20_10395 [Candidatus Angelobacter sp.]|nr:hypothetical protein [Candidatus Angelobacter sp.]
MNLLLEQFLAAPLADKISGCSVGKSHGRAMYGLSSKEKSVGFAKTKGPPKWRS